MITRLEIENFKAIKKVAIDLTPLTVLVGPNDAGKSTILQALDVLGRSVQGKERMPLHAGGVASVFPAQPLEYFPGQDPSLTIRIAAQGMGGLNEPQRPFVHELKIGWEDHDYRVNRHFDNVGVQQLASFFATFDPSRLAEPSAANAELSSRGDGLPGVVKRLLTSLDRGPLEKLEAHLRRLSKFVHRVGTRTLPDGREELLFSTTDGRSFPAREASSGLVLVTGYLALAFGTPHQFLLIEEPENGIHPNSALGVVDLLREMVAAGRQVIATTHSPIVLNYMEPEDVQIVTRTAEHGVVVTPMIHSRFFDERSQKFDLGELWYSVGEDALVSTAS